MAMVVERETANRTNGTVVVMFDSGRVTMIESVPFKEFQCCRQEPGRLCLCGREFTFAEKPVRLKWFDDEAFVYGY